MCLLFIAGLWVPTGCAPAHATEAQAAADKAHPELGIVRWGRDFEAAKRASRNSGKPMFVLFDEVPGCSTVQGFADRVLSHPAMADAIEQAFVPVAIMNNHGGKDKEVLDHFGEPAWNNPVVRLMDADENMLAPRSTALDVPTVALTMVRALERAAQPVPAYLRLVSVDAAPVRRTLRQAVFGMYCFWSGEVAFGSLDGVVATRPGHHHGEVVVVTYDPAMLPLETLLKTAKARGAADRVWLSRDEEVALARRVFGRADRLAGDIDDAAGDDKKQMQARGWAKAGLSVGQQTKVNAALGQRQDPMQYLSPRQQRAYAR